MDKSLKNSRILNYLGTPLLIALLEQKTENGESPFMQTQS